MLFEGMFGFRVLCLTETDATIQSYGIDFAVRL
jgi:hypothetical protein